MIEIAPSGRAPASVWKPDVFQTASTDAISALVPKKLRPRWGFFYSGLGDAGAFGGTNLAECALEGDLLLTINEAQRLIQQQIGAGGGATQESLSPITGRKQMTLRAAESVKTAARSTTNPQICADEVTFWARRRWTS